VGVDGSMARDASVTDAAIELVDATAADSALVDSGPRDAGLDVGVDSGPVCTCEPAHDCELAVCESGVCVRTAVPDGTLCATGLCVRGACVARGCGDGYREPGPDPAREACDDGNALDGDACSSSCVPTPLVVGARPDEDAWPLGPTPAVAVDGLGNVLVVFRVTDPTGGSLVAASRLSPTGALLDPLDTPLEVGGYAAAGRTQYASVAGLSGGGWVVVYDELKGDGAYMGIVARLVRPDGTLSSPLIVNELTRFDQRQPIVASYLDGFVAAWNDLSDSPLPISRLRLRRFDAVGRPLTGDLYVSVDGRQQNGPVVLGASGDTLYVVFGHPAPDPNDTPELHAWRFRGTGFIDATDLVLATRDAPGQTIAPLVSGELALVWRDLSAPPNDDLVGLRLAASGAPSIGTQVPFTVPGGTEQAPAVAALTGGHSIVVHAGARLRIGLSLVTSPGAPALPELDSLRTRLTGPTVGDGSVARGPLGVWVVWSEVPPGRRDRVVVAYLLPVDGDAP
jgi:cysteine-rich repeat protein